MKNIQIKKIEVNINNVIDYINEYSSDYDLSGGDFLTTYFIHYLKHNDSVEDFNNFYLNIGIYSRFFNETFTDADEYNEFIKYNNDVDFFNLAKFENFEYRIHLKHYKYEAIDHYLDGFDVESYAESIKENYKKQLNTHIEAIKETIKLFELFNAHENELADIEDMYLLKKDVDYNFSGLFKYSSSGNYYEIIEEIEKYEKVLKFKNKLNEELSNNKQVVKRLKV